MREWEQINYLVIDITTNKALVVRSCMVAGRITKLHGNEITIALEENGILRDGPIHNRGNLMLEFPVNSHTDQANCIETFLSPCDARS